MRNAHTLFAASLITLLSQGCSLQKWDEINEGDSAGSSAASSAHNSSGTNVGGAKTTSSAAASSRGGNSNTDSRVSAAGGGNSNNGYSSQSSGGNTTAAGGASNAGGDANTSTSKCEPGKRTCSNNVPQLCSRDGTWKAETACAGITPACVDGTCGCSPGTRKCAEDQKTPRLCSEKGTWQDEAACGAATPICTGAGTCGVCTEGERKCDGATPQLCSNKGQWEAQKACIGSNVCREGTCVACPGTGGPTMVGLPLGYCIDSTEVTRAQYLEWIKTAPFLANQPDICKWNDSYWPKADFTLPLAKPNYPVSSVDWCDAYAYCKNANKRLCGKIGGETLARGYDTTDAAESQWYAACSSNGVNVYPYGKSYLATACATAEAGTGTVAVGTNAGCQSNVPGYSGVFDLSGNVFEWVDACGGGTLERASCSYLGGDAESYGAPLGGPEPKCPMSVGNAIDYYAPGLGFRCCAF